MLLKTVGELWQLVAAATSRTVHTKKRMQTVDRSLSYESSNLRKRTKQKVERWRVDWKTVASFQRRYIIVNNDNYNYNYSLCASGQH